ncbi:MAG TPA: hypothetical protein ENI23_00170 [bacterium]|nr:hypothetical protein [bacterium]
MSTLAPSFDFPDINNYIKRLIQNHTYVDKTIKGKHLDQCQLEGIHFHTTTLYKTAFTDCNIKQGSFFNCIFNEILFEQCTFEDIRFHRCKFQSSEFVECLFDTEGKQIPSIRFYECTFTDVPETYFYNCEFKLKSLTPLATTITLEPVPIKLAGTELIDCNTRDLHIIGCQEQGFRFINCGPNLVIADITEPVEDTKTVKLQPTSKKNKEKAYFFCSGGLAT